MLQPQTCVASGGDDDWGSCTGRDDVAAATDPLFCPFPRAPGPCLQPVRALIAFGCFSLLTLRLLRSSSLLPLVGGSELRSLQAAVERAKYFGGAFRRKMSPACLAQARNRLAAHL